ANRARIQEFFTAHPNLKTHKDVYVPEGDYVAVFHPKVEGWLKQNLSPQLLDEMIDELRPHLKIELTERGFVRAANRSEDSSRDPTNYNAVWVRDAIWAYYGLRPEQPGEAGRLILALLDYYATPAQWERFHNIIAQPERAGED